MPNPIEKLFECDGFFLGNIYVLKFHNKKSKFTNNAFCLLHGFPAYVQKNYDIAENLCKMGFTVYVFHYSGLGLSKGKFYFKKSFEDTITLINFIEKEKYTTFSLVGHSWGGYVALNSFKFINKKGKLILLAPFSKLTSEIVPSLANVLITNPAYRTELSHYNYNTLVDELRGISRSNNVYENVKNISGSNVLLLHGTKDEEVPIEDSALLSKQFAPQPAYHVLEENHSFGNRRPELISLINSWVKNDFNMD
jgi:esterase/lipase